MRAINSMIGHQEPYSYSSNYEHDRYALVYNSLNTNDLNKTSLW